MIDSKKIVEIAESKIEGRDLFVVECRSMPGNEFELLIDSDTSVSLDDCVELSRAINAEFDREEDDFSLVVASSGVGSELKLLRQYKKLVGGSVEVLLNSGVKVVAVLESVDESGLQLSYDEKQAVEGKKRKQTVRVERKFGFEEIKSTREYLDFK